MSHNQAVGTTHDEPQIEGLQQGAKLLRGQYEILRFLSNGGFGITYLARDSLERDVVIKECFPGALCKRSGDLVEPADPEYKEDLRAIIDLFILEARNHARLVHPNIVNVHQVFEDNNTAYIAMDLIRGCDLLEYVENPENDRGPDFIVQVTEKMLSAVAFIHQSGMLHRDISPDNILIDEHHQPVLIDFGAAREQAAHKSAALMTLRVIKDGYSPHEFYVRGADQGPSSDLYVLAATLYHAISGERPIDGQTRLNAFNSGHADPYSPLDGRFVGYPKDFLKAIDKAMEVHATDRLQSALDWLRMFRGPDVMFDTFEHRPISVIVGMDRKDKEEEAARIKAESENAEAVVTALLAGNADLTLGNEDKADQDLAKFSSDDDNKVAVDTVVRSGTGGTKKFVLLAGVALIALAAGGFYVMSGNTGTPEASPEAAVANDAIAVAGEPIEQTAEAITEPKPAEPAPAADSDVAPTEPAQQEEFVTPEVAATLEPLAAALARALEEASDETAAEDLPIEAAAAPQLNETVAEDVTPVAKAASTPVNLSEKQVSFAHWDVTIPFQTALRRASTGNTIAVTAVNPNLDMSVIGEWVQRGATIFTLNGDPVRADLSLAAHFLDSFTVDPDGHIRKAARYRELGQTRAQNGLLALPAQRSIGLENGLTFEASHVSDSGWQTVVNSIANEGQTSLQVGDIVLRESNTDTAIDQPEALDAVLATLVAENTPEAKFTVLRNGTETTATMQLAGN
ncbi:MULTISPECIES: serine/threonine-protein kinase [unclassified Ruegeria]|uniref:serine/threonine protein kinase n=1 Tax=unclassified Ruegeria TaxID=2625375 RepID=UPI00148992E8|nr:MULTISPECIES: serine/threonine-protein kinase [unclassified Ruegeria]